MRFRIKYTFVLLLTVAAVSSRPAAGQVSQAPPPERPLRSDLAIDYSYLRTNAPPGGCTCFNLNGVSVNIAFPVKPGKFAFVADLTIDNIGKVTATAYSLTLSTFTVGARYLPKLRHSPFQPFGQIMAGAAHASGSLTLPPNPAAQNASLAFAASIGAGLDVHLNRRFGLRLAQADYYPTTFDNGSNNHQNNFRLSAGAVIHF
jgi:peptidoglycan-associated lipoprotein